MTSSKKRKLSRPGGADDDPPRHPAAVSIVDAVAALGLARQVVEELADRGILAVATTPRQGAEEVNKKWRGSEEENGGFTARTLKPSREEESDTELSSSILKVKDAVSSLRRSRKPKG